MTDFKPFTWMVWGGALAAFSGGCLGVSIIAKQYRISTDYNNLANAKNYRWDWHLILSLIPFALFLFGIYGIIQCAGNLLLLTGNPAKYMTKDFDYGYYSVLFSSAPLVVLLYGTASFKKINPNKIYRTLSKFMVVLVIILNLLAYPNRGTLFFDVGILIILFNYLHKRISPIWILLCLAFAASAFMFISSLRDQFGSGSIGKMTTNAIVEIPYKYVANNYWNLDYALNPPNDNEYHPNTYGIDFFFGIFEYTRIPGSFRNTFRWDGLFNEHIEKIHGFNTASYLWEVYKDLYMPGIFLLPFICGLMLSTLHLRLCKPFTPRQLMFYTLFVYFIGWWFFTPGYKQGIYWCWLFILFFITTVCMRQKRLPTQPIIVNKVDEQNCT